MVRRLKERSPGAIETSGLRLGRCGGERRSRWPDRRMGQNVHPGSASAPPGKAPRPMRRRRDWSQCAAPATGFGPELARRGVIEVERPARRQRRQHESCFGTARLPERRGAARRSGRSRPIVANGLRSGRGGGELRSRWRNRWSGENVSRRRTPGAAAGCGRPERRWKERQPRGARNLSFGSGDGSRAEVEVRGLASRLERGCGRVSAWQRSASSRSVARWFEPRCVCGERRISIRRRTRA